MIKIINRYAALVNMSGHILLQSFWSVLGEKQLTVWVSHLRYQLTQVVLEIGP